MALKGLDIFKLLPKTNCKECGQPTCLAFAMALASGKATLEQCPHVSEEAKETLESATAPPMKLIKIGAGDNVLEIGDEQVLFRHDKTFYHPTGLFIEVADTLSEEEITARVAEINALVFERVGEQYAIDGIAISNVSGEAETFKKAAELVAAKTDKVLALITEDPAAMEAAASVVAGRKPLLYAATGENYEKMAEVAQKYGAVLAVKGKNLNDLAEVVDKVTAIWLQRTRT